MEVTKETSKRNEEMNRKNIAEEAEIGEVEREIMLLRQILKPYFSLEFEGKDTIISVDENGRKTIYIVRVNPPSPMSVEVSAAKVIEKKPNEVVVITQIEDWVFALKESLREKGFDIPIRRLSPIDIGAMTAGVFPFSEHIGIAVRSLDEAENKFQDVLGVRTAGRHRVETEGLTASFIWIGSTRIELLEPFSESSAVASFLEKKGEGIHHIAVEVDNFDKKVEELKQKGYRLIGPRKGATGKRVVFIHPKDFMGILLELVEKGYRKEGFS